MVTLSRPGNMSLIYKAHTREILFVGMLLIQRGKQCLIKTEMAAELLQMERVYDFCCSRDP